MSVLEQLPAHPERVAAAQELMARLATDWRITAAPSQRWLLGARDLLAGHEDLDLFAQYDDVLQIVSIELWVGGARVFGIDDWVG